MSKKFVTIDGNAAASHVAYAFSEVAAIYPITPSSPMGEMADAWASNGRNNIFGQKLDVIEMQSEAGAAGAVHGVLSGGSLTTTFTASQGLLLMIPNMYKIAGEMLPTVFHVSARSLATQSLSIFGDHSDVMSVRPTGFALIAASSVQETMDLAFVSHLATLDAQVPFLNFFDGFRTSHEIQKVEEISYDTMKSLFNTKHLERFRARALNPENPTIKVAAQNPDVYFQGRETVNKYYDALPEIVQKYMDKVGDTIGRKYKLFDYIGAADADKIIIAMGSANETIDETVNYLLKKGEKVGAVKVRLYRPFSVKHLMEAVPSSVKKIAVLDRTKEPGSIGEPLYMDIKTAYSDTDMIIIGGRYGLSSKEFTPSMVKAVYDHLDGKCTHNFTVGINDDVTNLSIDIKDHIDTEPEDVVRCLFWGYGSDGTVGANKNSIKIIGDNTDMYAQGYFSYDSKKSGGITISYLRFGKDPIKSTYLITKSDFVALHKPEYIGRYDILDTIKDGGTFLLNSEWSNDEVFNHLTEDLQKTIIDRKIKFYNINAYKIAEEVGLAGRINTVMQAAFFKISGVLEGDKAIDMIKQSIKKTYIKKGEDIVKMNWECVDKTAEALVEIKVPAGIEKSVAEKVLIPEGSSSFAKNVIEPVMRLKGNDIPVSCMAFDGLLPLATTQIEKRAVAVEVPHWISENCIQCNQCAYVCPHATIRAKQFDPETLKDAPSTFKTIKSKTKNDRDLEYKIQVYVEDCVGCGSCAQVCPSKEKSLVMTPLQKELDAGEVENTTFFNKQPHIADGAAPTTLKGSQFIKPLFEFSGACAGCGETPYVKLVTQLFGDRMIVANATGCSSIYGGTFPTIPYAVNDKGHGPAWANSLFEDNAEYGFGMRLAVDSNRVQLRDSIEKILKLGTTDALKAALTRSLELWDKVDDEAKESAEAVVKNLDAALGSASGEAKEVIAKIIELKNYIVDKSVWIFGGDGWAYDIGYGGLDHVLAAGKNVNVLVLDTEVYSNTGGQASKATPIAAIAKFAASGKKMGKKDLGLISMSYGHIYVASVNMGANKMQVLKALLEAEAYDGPSIVIAYSGCISHGFNMTNVMAESKLATDSGHWPLYRFDPRLTQEGKNPLQWESKDPSVPFKDYIMNERRYSSLKDLFPDHAEELYEKSEQDAKRRFDHLKKLSSIE